MLSHLEELFINYVGVSKLWCRGCSHFIESVNSTKRIKFTPRVATTSGTTLGSFHLYRMYAEIAQNSRASIRVPLQIVATPVSKIRAKGGCPNFSKKKKSQSTSTSYREHKKDLPNLLTISYRSGSGFRTGLEAVKGNNQFIVSITSGLLNAGYHWLLVASISSLSRLHLWSKFNVVYRFYSSRLEIGNVRDAGLSDEKTQGRGKCNEQSYKSNSLPHVVSLITQYRAEWKPHRCKSSRS